MAALLPHRARSVVLDEVVEATATDIVCRVRLRVDSRFVEGDRMPVVACVEHMAQAAAAFLGVRALAAGEPILPGLLVGLRSLDLAVDELEVDDVLDVYAEHLWGLDMAATFACSVRRGGQPVCEATLNVKRIPS